MEHPHFLSGSFVPSSRKLFDRSRLYEIHRTNGTTLKGRLALNEAVLRAHKLLNFCIELSPSDTPWRGISTSRGFDSARITASAIWRGHVPNQLGRHLGNIVADIDVLAIYAFHQSRKWILARSSRPLKPSVFHLHYMTEQMPNSQSRVSLSEDKDRFDQNMVRLNWQLSEDDIQSAIRAQDILDEELTRSELGRLERERYDEIPPPGIRGGFHHMGTTRMHTDPTQGVVDENGRIHGISNLYVAGPSVFPTSGYANPALTIAALSIRLADHIKSLSSS